MLPCHACCYLHNRFSFLCTLTTPLYSKAQTKQGTMEAEARNRSTTCMCAQVLGLTVLAWGNSVGDMSTNMAMARKGLANMAMTACYAGPVFNLLVRPPTTCFL